MWSQAAKIDVLLADGKTEQSFFIKLTETYVGKIMSQGEYESMKALYRFNPDIIPRPVGWGTFETAPDLSFFICEFKSIFDEVYPSPTALGSALATLHKSSQRANPGRFGFDVVTCNGTVEQLNTWCDSWEEFFSNKVLDLFRKDEIVHGPCPEYAELKPAFFDRVIPRLLRPLETGGNTLEPCLVHGYVFEGV